MVAHLRRLSAGWHFASLTATLLCLLAGCSGDKDPVTSSSSKFKPAESGTEQPADATAPAKASADAAAEDEPRKANDKTGEPAAGEDAAAGSIPDSPFAAKGKSASAPAEGGATAGKYPLPQGNDTRALLRFIDELGGREPQGTSREEVLADAIAIQEARLAAGKRALAGKLDKTTRAAVVNAIMQIHELLAQMGVRDAFERIEAFNQELIDSKDPELAEIGRLQGFRLRVMKIMSSEPKDASEIADEVKQLVASEKDSVNAFVLATQVCDAINEVAESAAALRPGLVEMLTVLGSNFKENSEKQVASRAQAHLDLARAWEIDVFGKCDEAAQARDAESESKLLAAVTELLSQPNVSTFSHAQKVAYKLEAEVGNYDVAMQVYDALAKAFAGHENTKLEEAASTMAANAHKRVGLIGKPLAVEGVLIDGKPFDPKLLEGKVVLVDFWATWCGPCLREFPNIRRNYLDYRDRGFEVVGISLDNEMAMLEQFFSRMELPWTVVISQQLFDKKTIDTQKLDSHPLGEACGIDRIPFVVLIGKDGNVDSIHVRGEKLGKRLAELLGDANASSEKPTGKAAAEKPGEKQPADARPAEKTDSPKDSQEDDQGGCGAAEPAAQAAAAESEEESQVNPYSAKPGLSVTDLVKYIDKMLDKPKTIQSRPGFAEALCEACDRVLAANPPPSEADQLLAAETKFETLHKAACGGDTKADEQLAAFCEQMKGDARPKIAARVTFFALERKVLEGDKLSPEQIDALLKELSEYFAKEKLTARHLRMASSTVALINRIENGQEREKHFVSFGNAFAKSSDKELARYGKKLAKKPAAAESDLVGKEMELAGTTASGAAFDWKKYRGKIVLVDFWATWCGPCLREMPHVRELYDRLHAKGFEVVGVSLDKDADALSTFLEENQLPWETLAGDETQELAEKYGVRGIPTMMIVDKEGKILGVAHQVQALVPIIEKALP